jgi:hypothetical protein
VLITRFVCTFTSVSVLQCSAHIEILLNHAHFSGTIDAKELNVAMR